MLRESPLSAFTRNKTIITPYIMTCVSMCSGSVHDHGTTIVLSQSKRPPLSIHILPDDMGMLYLSECRLLMAPTLGTLAGVITEGPWVIGVTGAVGVVGV